MGRNRKASLLGVAKARWWSRAQWRRAGTQDGRRQTTSSSAARAPRDVLGRRSGSKGLRILLSRRVFSLRHLFQQQGVGLNPDSLQGQVLESALRSAGVRRSTVLGFLGGGLVLPLIVIGSNLLGA